MITTWDDLPFWQSGEWQVIEERLDELDKHHTLYNPRRDLLFAALDACPYSDCRVAILGQDPYPHHDMAMGLAFSVPRTCEKHPPTLQNLLKEYSDDLGLPVPNHGDLSVWAEQGVLLWNAIPSCEDGKASSHRSWPEWDVLTQQIVEALSDKGIVFGLLGGHARAYAKFIDREANEIVETAHPSPLAVATKAKDPFLGSRFFSTINDKLIGMKLTPIEWRLA
jgi:uracil-DNA glycosylase